MQLKNIIKIILVIIGTSIGAGFASGKEIYVFFTQYGKLSIIGMAISSILLGLVIFITLQCIKKFNIINYTQMSKQLTNSSKGAKLLQIIVKYFSLVSFYIMVAGFTAYIFQNFHLESNLTKIYIISGIFVIICTIIVRKNVKGIMKFNTIVIPIIVLFIIIIGIKNNSFVVNIVTNKSVNILTVIISSILYMSYNSILLIQVLIGMKEYIENKKQIISISSISAILFFILSIMIQLILSRGIFYISDLELPILAIMQNMGGIYIIIYGIIMIIAIITSAISAEYSFLENTRKKKYTYICIIIGAIFMSSFSFTKLVQVLYPLFGILGLIQIILQIKRLRD